MPEILVDLNRYVKNNESAGSPRKGPLTRALAGANVKNDEIEMTSEDGRKNTVRVNGQAMHDSEGNKLGAVISLHDITDLNKVKKQLRFMAYHDALTSLPNRRLFHDLLEQSLKKFAGMYWPVSRKKTQPSM
jgi:hypothetical protein